MRFIAATVDEFRNNTVGIPVITVLVLSFVMAVMAAWFSQGYLHPDEHFQILEFAHWRHSNEVASQLAWEFKSRIRPAAQPAYACLVNFVLQKAGVVNPFFEAFLLRLTAGVLGWLVSLMICLYGFRWIADSKAKNWFFLATNFIWFQPFMHCRFSAENMGGSLCALGVLLTLFMLDNHESTRTNIVFTGVLAGFVFGFGVFSRIQMVAALLGFSAWLLFIRKTPWHVLWLLTLAFCAAIAMNIMIDRWFYRAWVFTPVNYIKINLWEGAANNWGTQPWWFLFVHYLGILVPPYSLLIFIAIVAAWIKYWKNPFVWISVPFIAAHTFVAHKEVRFLLPLGYELVLLFILGWQALPKRWREYFGLTLKKNTGRWLLASFVVINMVLLAVFTFKPANESINVYKWLYHASAQKSLNLYTLGGSPYRVAGLQVNYYRASGVLLDSLNTIAQLKTAVDTSTTPVYLLTNGFSPPDSLRATGLRFRLQVRSIPAWAHYVNSNHWLSRVRVWSIFLCERAY